MKSLFSVIVIGSLILWASGCKEPTIDEGILPFTDITQVDANGGTWRPIVLRTVTEISVPQPVAITSATYQQELSSVKSAVSGASPEQNTAVNYWAAGGVLRWNQIARQLVSKYNILPGFDASTGQTTPAEAANALAGEPFAARIYALLSVAQYDALVVAWRAKYQYNRPSLESQGVLSRVPVLNVPSYPSEDAAIAEASCQMLAYLFPAETEWLKAKATEHKQSRLWAGASVPSDLKAGEELANNVMTRILARARIDRFANAADPANSWQTALTRAAYDQKWKSLELPARAPILPLAGRVKTWFDSTTIYRALPTAPPVTTSTDFQKALTEVRDVANSRSRDQSRIANYWANGNNTYGLAGLWNYLTEDLIRQAGQNELRAARTYALLNRAIQDSETAVWATKYTYFVPRPSQIDATIKTAVPIPNTPSYVSDQATVSMAAVMLLAHIFPSEATSLNAKATESAVAGIYSGTQYRFDTEKGIQLGNLIGQQAVNGAKADGAN